MSCLRLRVILGCISLVGAASCSEEAKKSEAPGVSSIRVPEKPVSAQAIKLCEHGVPAEQCTQCKPELSDVFKEKGDWCQSHGVPESHCFKCNPKLTFAEAPSSTQTGAWCNEHGVPEAMCTKCKPQLIAKFIEAGDYCREHGLPESVCPHCRPERAKAAGHELPKFPKPGTKVRLASPETEREAGVETVIVSLKAFAKSIDVVGQVAFDGNRFARLSARGEGLVTDVRVDLGDDVKRGQPLLLLASAGIGQDQSRLVAARARTATAQSNLAREQSLQSSGISPKKSVEQAQAELAAAQADYDAARAALRAAGAGESSSGGAHALTAPFDGTVVARAAVVGKTVSAETPLVEIADMSVMWALLDVPEDLAASVRPGQKVKLTLQGLGGEVWEGVINRMSASVDPRTRTVQARVDLPNPDRSLRAGLFVRAKVEVAAERNSLLVPRDAVQRAEGRALVFVRSGPGEYEPMPVELGARTENEVEITSGLSPGAAVVTTGAFVLKTEILKDSIGAGCADD